MNFSRLKQSLTNLITYKGPQDSYDFSVNISTSKNITNEANDKVSSNLKDNKNIIDRIAIKVSTLDFQQVPISSEATSFVFLLSSNIFCLTPVKATVSKEIGRSILNIFSKISRNELMHNKDIVDISMLMEGTMPNILNYSNFVFSNDGIIIYFSYYQVAPYSSGMFEVLINYKYLWYMLWQTYIR